MCWSCNPRCGGCRPPRQRAVKCPECGTFNLFDIEIRDPVVPRQCKKCALDLTGEATPVPVLCKRSGKPCANPCRQNTKEPGDGGLVDCKMNTPPPGVVWAREDDSPRRAMEGTPASG